MKAYFTSATLALVLASSAWAQQRSTVNSSGFGGGGGSSQFGTSSSGSGFSGSGGAGSGSMNSGQGFIGSTSTSLTGAANTNRNTQGGGGGGQFGGGGQLGGSTTTFTIATSNPFSGFYVNPFQDGVASSSTRSSFGRPLYQSNTRNQLGSSSMGASTPRSSFGSSGANNAAPKPAAYSGEVAFEYQPPAAQSLQANAQEFFSRSSTFANNPSVTVIVEGNGLVIRGQVADARERRLAEAMLRMTPGVREVRNELQLRSQAPALSQPQPLPQPNQ